MTQRPLLFALLFALLFGALACSAPGDPPPGPATPAVVPEPPPIDLSWLAARDKVTVPQLEAVGETPIVVWREVGEDGVGLYLAELSGRLPTRVDDDAGALAPYDHDEFRPSVAVAPDGRVAVAWTDRSGDVRAAIAPALGQPFGSSLRLNQDPGEAAQSFPSVAFGADGALHAVWLDARVAADPRLEEPADLYLGTVREGEASERNLTADESPSVCGCCRPFLGASAGGSLEAAFRNVSADGYRDIHRFADLEATAATPERIGPATWKIEGCPMSGPVLAAGSALWVDGSTGESRLVAGRGSNEPLSEPGPGGGWSPRLSPRLVTGRGDAEPWVLVPGSPTSILLAPDEEGWTAKRTDLPAWATSALEQGGSLRLIGVEGGVPKAASVVLD